MSARAIVPGVVFRAPEAKTSKAGKRYVVATIREGTGDALRWWKGIAFSESAAEALLEIRAGEPVGVAGAIDAELYTPAGGEARISFKVTVDAVLSAKAKPKPRTKQAKVDRLPSSSPAREADLDDDLPF